MTSPFPLIDCKRRDGGARELMTKPKKTESLAELQALYDLAGKQVKELRDRQDRIDLMMTEIAQQGEDGK